MSRRRKPQDRVLNPSGEEPDKKPLQRDKGNPREEFQTPSRINFDF
jgi:hypothetical protein